jgi:hypothetical protein
MSSYFELRPCYSICAIYYLFDGNKCSQNIGLPSPHITNCNDPTTKWLNGLISSIEVNAPSVLVSTRIYVWIMFSLWPRNCFRQMLLFV